MNAFPVGGRVVGKGAVDHGQDAAIIDTAAFRRHGILGKGAIGDRGGAGTMIDATAAIGFVMGKGAVLTVSVPTL